MKSYILPVILQLIGILVIMAEIFIPSFGILSVLAVCIFLYSLFIVFTDISINVGIFFVCADAVMIPIFIIVGLKLLAKSPLALKKELSKSEGIVSQSPTLETYLNMTGQAVTDLRPAGAAIIDGKRLDVVTDGEYIEKETPIKVTDVTGNQIIVEKIK